MCDLTREIKVIQDRTREVKDEMHVYSRQYYKGVFTWKRCVLRKRDDKRG